MPAKSFQWNCINQAWSDRWSIGQVDLATTGLMWGALVAVADMNTVSVKDKSGKACHMHYVGHPAVSPGIDTLSVSWTLEEEQVAGQSYGQPPFFDNADLRDYGSGYYGYAGTIGSVIGFPTDADYWFDSDADFRAALQNGEITPLEDTVYFDVYIDGIDKPSIFTNWTAGEDLSPVELQPKVWIACQALLPTYPDVTMIDNINQPNTAAWQVDSAGQFSYGGSYDTTYLSIEQNFYKYLNTANRLIQWGLNGEPEYIRLYLRMDSEINGIGELFCVQIGKDGSASATKIDDSSTTTSFYTVVRIHAGEPDYVPPQDDSGYNWGRNYNGDDDGQYDPDDKPDPTDFTDPVGFDGNNVLTKTYAVSAADLRNIGQKLWSQDYFDVLRIQNNPIENIVSVKHFPFAMSGTVEEIKIGDVAFGVNGNKIASVQSYRTLASLKIGSYTFTGKYHNYLDLSPYTACKLFLPYIGFVQLDPAEIYGSEITVFYFVDLVTGQCMARIVLDEQTIEGDTYSIPYMSVFGQMGIDIPLTSSDRVQTELRAASAALTAVGGSAGQIISGNVGGGVVSGLSDALSIAGADYTTQRTSSQTPACASFDCQDVFLMVERPAAEYVDRDAMTGYKHLHGAPCHKYLRLSDKVFKDGHFVQIEKRTDLQIAATSEENRMLEQLLTSGVYI